MILYIDTVLKDKIVLALIKENKGFFQLIAFKKMKSTRDQAEKLLPGIDALLIKNNFSNKKIKKIFVNNHGGSFSSLRIGVVTANALAFALKIPIIAASIFDETGDFNLSYKKGDNLKINYLKGNKSFSSYYLVEPFYNSEPNIGPKKTC